MGKLRLIYLADEILEAPEMLIQAVQRGKDTQYDYDQSNPTGFSHRTDVSNEEEYRRIADESEEEIPAEDVVYGLKGVNDGQEKKYQKGEG